MSKLANIIIIGGTIAAGKSSLVDALAKKTGWQPVPELRENDDVQEIVLKKLYDGTRLHLATVQYYFISNRYKQYVEVADGMVTAILDRGVWEDLIFSKLLMVNEKKSFQHYKELWSTTIKKLLKNQGAPKAYIFLTVDWDTFKERIYSRNREAEIVNFSRNEEYFRNLLDEYNQSFVEILENWDITPIVINTVGKNKDEVIAEAFESLKSKGLM